jgi:hypothetical protein
MAKTRDAVKILAHLDRHDPKMWRLIAAEMLNSRVARALVAQGTVDAPPPRRHLRRRASGHATIGSPPACGQDSCALVSRSLTRARGLMRSDPCARPAQPSEAVHAARPGAYRR